jgi:hypothetical protein
MPSRTPSEGSNSQPPAAVPTRTDARPRSIPVAHHLVSKGYQRNFATPDRKVTVLSALDGTVIEQLRPTKRNWAEPHWNSVLTAAGQYDARLEVEWARLEPSVLRRIREVSVASCRPEHRGAIINLFAIHLVRSRTFESFRSALHADAIERVVNDLVADDELIARFVRSAGRQPTDGEIASMARVQADVLESSRQGLVDSMVSLHNKIAAKLDEYRIQVIEVPDRLPGFVLADVPVVHADLSSLRFGFRDHLAVGDANLVIGPLTRRIAVCFTASSDSHVVVKSKAKVLEVNNLLRAGAVREVACHPDDAQVIARLLRNPPPVKRP